MELQLRTKWPPENDDAPRPGSGTTTTLKDAAPLIGGGVLSVARTVIGLVVLTLLAGVVQEKLPEFESIEAPAGAPGSRLKVSGFESGSVACAVKWIV